MKRDVDGFIDDIATECLIINEKRKNCVCFYLGDENYTPLLSLVLLTSIFFAGKKFLTFEFDCHRILSFRFYCYLLLRVRFGKGINFLMNFFLKHTQKLLTQDFICPTYLSNSH